MGNEKPNNAVQQKVAQLAASMTDLFMPCSGEGMVLGYTAILVLERAIREDMPTEAVNLARDMAKTVRATVETEEEKKWQDEK